MENKKYYCYVLRSKNPEYLNKTYNGSTNNLVRRLRQHNGEIVGGAKATQGKGPWEMYIIWEGFSSKREALSCEWRIKHPTNKKIRPSEYNGIIGRVKSLEILVGLDNWTNKSVGMGSECNIQKEYKLYIDPKYMDLIDITNKKSNLEIMSIDNFENK